MRLLSLSSACSRGHRSPSLRGAAEAPLLALLGLGLFFWIFLTNSLPAKRELAGRLAQVERYAGPGGRIEGLRRELAEEEALARAVREDPVVRRALFLLEHPSAPENAPDQLLTALGSHALPEEPETLVDPAASDRYDDLLEELPPEPRLPGGSPSTADGGASAAEVPRTTDAAAEGDPAAPVDAREVSPPGAREERAVPPAAGLPKTRGADGPAEGRTAPAGRNRVPGADLRSGAGPQAGRAPGATVPKSVHSKLQAVKQETGKQATGKQATGKQTAAKPTARQTGSPRPTGSFEVPSFLRG